MSRTEKHNAIVTRNVPNESDDVTNLRGGVFFEAPTLFEGEYPEAAFPCFPFASNNGAGMFWVPKPGDEIEVWLLVEDENNPFDTSDIEVPEPRYICMIYNDVNEVDEEFLFNYPNRMGWKTNSGHIILFDDGEGVELFRMAHALGQFIEMNAGGQIKQKSLKDFITDVGKDEIKTVRRNQDQTVLGSRFTDVYKDNTNRVRGNRSDTVDGNYDLTVVGKRTENYNEIEHNVGSKVDNITGGNTTNTDGGKKDVVGGSWSRAIISNDVKSVAGEQRHLVAGVTEKTYGLGYKTTIALGNHEIEVVIGDIIHTLLAGNFTQTLTAGGITIGNLLASLAIGVAGDLTVGNLIGSLAFDAAGNPTLVGPLTTIGPGAAPSNALTLLTDPVVDTITGAPHIGLPTVLLG